MIDLTMQVSGARWRRKDRAPCVPAAPAMHGGGAPAISPALASTARPGPTAACVYTHSLPDIRTFKRQAYMFGSRKQGTANAENLYGKNAGWRKGSQNDQVCCVKSLDVG